MKSYKYPVIIICFVIPTFLCGFIYVSYQKNSLRTKLSNEMLNQQDYKNELDKKTKLAKNAAANFELKIKKIPSRKYIEISELASCLHTNAQLDKESYKIIQLNFSLNAKRKLTIDECDNYFKLKLLKYSYLPTSTSRTTASENSNISLDRKLSSIEAPQTLNFPKMPFEESAELIIKYLTQLYAEDSAEIKLLAEKITEIKVSNKKNDHELEMLELTNEFQSTFIAQIGNTNRRPGDIQKCNEETFSKKSNFIIDLDQLTNTIITVNECTK